MFMTNKLKEKIEEAKKEHQARYELYIPMAQEAEETLAVLRETAAPNKVEIRKKGDHSIIQYTEKINHLDAFILRGKDSWKLLLVHPDDPEIAREICYFGAIPGKWYIPGSDIWYQSFAELLESKAKTIASYILDLEHRWKMENKQ